MLCQPGCHQDLFYTFVTILGSFFQYSHFLFTKKGWLSKVIKYLLSARACFCHHGRGIRIRVGNVHRRVMSVEDRYRAAIGAPSVHRRSAIGPTAELHRPDIGALSARVLSAIGNVPLGHHTLACYLEPRLGCVCMIFLTDSTSGAYSVLDIS